MHWDGLRTFEAVARLGSLTSASRALGVSQSTVSRHLSKLEAGAGSPLLLRESPIRLTERGVALLAAVQPMVESALVARAALDASPELRGQVTIATVGEVVRWVLAQALRDFCETHPQLRLRILADNQIISLAAGEADLALRMARPERGELVGRKLRTESFGFYTAASLPRGSTVPWLGLTGSLAHIPEQRHAARAFSDRPARLLVEDLESLGLLVEGGLGVAVLPRGFASRLDSLVECEPQDVGALDMGPIATRDLWMVVHRSKQRLPKVRAVIDWLAVAIADNEVEPRS